MNVEKLSDSCDVYNLSGEDTPPKAMAYHRKCIHTNSIYF